MAADNLVEVTKLRKEFGGLVATDDVDFTIPRGRLRVIAASRHPRLWLPGVPGFLLAAMRAWLRPNENGLPPGAARRRAPRGPGARRARRP
mgnify:CR=1 FL=1